MLLFSLFFIVQIVDSVTRETLGPNQSGELCIRGDHVMLGYVNQNEATEQAFDGEGWLLTGKCLSRLDGFESRTITHHI